MSNNTVCPVCAGDVVFDRGFDYGRLNKCLHCGSKFLDTAHEMTYGQDYYQSWFEDSQQIIEKIKRTNFRHLLTREVGPVKGKRFLDIGCATGFMLLEALNLEAEVFGLDVNEWAVSQARERLPTAGIFAGSLADAVSKGDLKPESFEVIVGTDVIEHISDVKPFLRDVLRLLVVGGDVFFTLPDIESFSCQALGSHWFQYKLEHVTFLTRSALAGLAVELGFRVERIVPHRKILTAEFVCNVLRYHNSGLFGWLGLWGGKVARGLGLERIMFPVWTGEMLVQLKKI